MMYNIIYTVYVCIYMYVNMQYVCSVCVSCLTVEYVVRCRIVWLDTQIKIHASMAG